MRLNRELSLAAALLVGGAALFWGGGAGGGAFPWLGGGALIAIVLLAALQGVPRGWPTLVPLAALAAWLGASVSWSTLPDRSWEYANRSLVYLVVAVLGLWLAPRRRELALGLAALLGAVVVWSLLGKVLPPVGGGNDPFGGARLEKPVGLWNQLALLGDFGLVLGLWLAVRRRVAGTLLVYAWVVALVLTLSRGGIAVAVVLAIAWLALSEDALSAVATLVAAGLPAGLVAGIAFALPGVTSGGQSNATRWRDGLIFGALLIAGAAVTTLLARAPRPRPTAATRRAALGLAAVLVLAALVAGGLKAGSAWRQFTSSAEVSNAGPSRFSSAGSNFRWVWWKQAWDGWETHRIAGTGAGSFQLTNLRYRTSYLDTTTEPHDLPVQFLSETGIVGLLLAVLAFGALLARGRRRPPHDLALSLILPAYLLHSLVDIDWDFVAVSAPAFLVAGSLAGGPVRERRVSPFATLAAAGVALAAFFCLLLPWLGNRWADSAPQRARAVDPLLVEPLWTLALNASERDDIGQALAYSAIATRMQPDNPYTWRFYGQLALIDARCPRLAYPALQRFTNLDDHDRPEAGATLKDQALKYVDSGRPDPRHCDAYPPSG